MSERAAELAYRYVARRERTVHELRKHLVSRGLAAPEIDGAVEELVETGYLDDARYARLFVQDKRGIEQWGSERIRRGLLSRGIERDVVDAALATDVWDEDAPAEGDSELGRALAVLERRFPDPPSDRRERERALATLVRRGYEPELALDAIAAHSRGRAG